MPPSSPWGDLAAVAEGLKNRTTAPRDVGLTMIIDVGLGLAESADLIESAGAFIDHWKLSFGTSVFFPEAVLRRKLDLIADAGILTCPGGTLFEAAILHQKCRTYMLRCAELGFRAVEISTGTIRLPAARRKKVVECALEADLIPIAEVGRKDPEESPTAEQLADEALQYLDWGARWVIIEGRESGKGVGVFGAAGEVHLQDVETIAYKLDDRVDRLLWEAPLKSQQSALIRRFGNNVNLGNIDPRRVLALEALRAGLRYETLRPLADALQQTGRWKPERPEPADDR